MLVQLGFVVLLLGHSISADLQVFNSPNPVRKSRQMAPLTTDYEGAFYSSEDFSRSRPSRKFRRRPPNEYVFVREDEVEADYNDEDDYDEDEDEYKDPVLLSKKYDKFEKVEQAFDKIHNKIYDKYLHIKTKTPPEPPDWAKEPVPSIEYPPWYT